MVRVVPSSVAIFTSNGKSRSRWRFCSPWKMASGSVCQSSSWTGFKRTGASEKLRNQQKGRVVTLPSSVAIFASNGESRSRWLFCSPWKTASELVSIVSPPTSLLSLRGLGNWTICLYVSFVLFEFGLGKRIYEGFWYPMSLGVLFANVDAFEWAFDQLDWCNFWYTFSENGMMLHLMHFRRFFTKVLLSALSGAPSKYVVDILTQIQKDAPSLSASRRQTPRVTWHSDQKIYPWADLWSYAPPSLDTP